jgi:hypothetical protein
MQVPMWACHAVGMRIAILILIACSAAIARAACDPHPMEHFMLQPDHTALLGNDPCELRAETATTATLSCAERTYHLTWVAP